MHTGADLVLDLDFGLERGVVLLSEGVKVHLGDMAITYRTPNDRWRPPPHIRNSGSSSGRE